MTGTLQMAHQISLLLIVSMKLTLECRIVRPHPPITRGLQYAKEKLQAAGIKVVDWEPFKHDHGWEIIVRTICT